MIYSEAPEIRSDSPKSPQFLSEEVIVPCQNKKKCTEGVLNALEVIKITTIDYSIKDDLADQH